MAPPETKKPKFTKQVKPEKPSANADAIALKKQLVEKATDASEVKDREMQKLIKLQRKASKTPMAELIVELKKIWEKLRVKHMAKQDRQLLVNQTIPLVRGHLGDLIFKHDASRIIQSLLKYSRVDGTETGRLAVLQELKGSFVEMAKSAYGRFAVIKALKYAPNGKVRSEIIAEFTAKQDTIAKLIRHKSAGFIIDNIYCLYASNKERQQMQESFYGTEFALLKSSGALRDLPSITLASVLERFPDKRERILTQLKTVLADQQVKEGNIGRNEILHRVMLDLLSNQSLEQLQELVMSQTGPFHALLTELPTIVHTKPGSQIALIVIAAAGAKERKAILKALKPHAKAIACDSYGWSVLCRVYDSVDDTVLIKSCVSGELIGKEDEASCLLTDRYGRMVLLHLLARHNTKYFSPDLIASLNTGSDWMAQTSKKDPLQRRKEVMTFLLPSLLKDAESTDALYKAMEQWPSNQAVVELLKFAKTADASTDAAVDALCALIVEPVVSVQEQESVDSKQGQKRPREDSSDDESDADDEGNQDDDKMQVDENAELAVNPQYAQEEEEAAASARRTHLFLHPYAPRVIKRMMLEVDGVASKIQTTLEQTPDVLAQLEAAKAQNKGVQIILQSLQQQKQ